MNIPIHDPNTCKECKRRYKENKSQNSDMYDPAYCKKDLDDEYQEIKPVTNKLEEITNEEENKWFCGLCNVRCFSEEYYRNHMKGNKHKNNKNKDNKDTGKRQEEKPTQTKPGHDNKPNPPKQDNPKNPDMTRKEN